MNSLAETITRSASLSTSLVEASEIETEYQVAIILLDFSAMRKVDKKNF